MITGHPSLIECLRAEIRQRGPQPFAWFMEQALYHPEFGYYSSDRAEIGRRGDYFTNVSVGPLFGQSLAAQFAEIWERLGTMDEFTVVEQGAHHGEFARDVLESLRLHRPKCFSALQYRIIEPFPKLQVRQSAMLQEFGRRVRWHHSIGEMESFVGVHFSNELLDSMPINLQAKLVGVTESGDEFVLVDSAIEQTRNQSQLDWVDQLAARLERGFVLAVDYGFASPDFREMLQVRAKHRLLDSPFEEIGHADISAHINWTEIADRGEKNGLRTCGFTDQHHFLTGIISSFGELAHEENSRAALKTLLHPEMLGRSFQVLGLAKDVESGAGLSGFRFARDARAVLGL